MCGSTSAQHTIQSEQISAYQTLNDEAKQVFGMDTALYNQLLTAFTPILKAGPSQQGFSSEELSALDTQAMEGTSENFQNAEKAVRSQYASEGGGNEYIPSGQEEQIEADVGAQAAKQISSEENQITEANYETGRNNWLTALQGLEEAPSVMAGGATYGNAATGAGSAASTTANEIAQADASPFNAVMGAVGSLGSAVISENPRGIFD